VPAACLYDGDNPCGENQELSSDKTLCVCKDAYVWTEGGCAPCGENEVVGAQGCECEEGYFRGSAGGICQPVEDSGDKNTDADDDDDSNGDDDDKSSKADGSAGAGGASGDDGKNDKSGKNNKNDDSGKNNGSAGAGGAPDDGAAGDGALPMPPPPPEDLGVECTDDDACSKDFPHCEIEEEGEPGYCTNTECEAPEDCLGGYACDLAVEPAVCRRPPLGLFQPCENADDCAGTEATWCDTAYSFTCMQTCSLDAPGGCFIGTECCDLSAFGVPEPLCVLEGMCFSP